MGRIFLSNRMIIGLTSSTHIAKDSMKTLHIKYKNLLHIHPFNSSLYITRSSCQSNPLYLTSSMTRLWQQQAEMSPSPPKGRWYSYRAGATRAQIHKVTSFFFLPIPHTRGKDGRGEHWFGSRQSSWQVNRHRQL